FLALDLFFERAYLGKALSACSSNPYAARVVGIDVTRMGLFAFALGGALGGLAGVLLGPLRPTSFDADVSLVIEGFAAAILGGLTRPILALMGGLLLGVAEAMVAGYVNGSYQTDVGLVLMLAVMIGQTARRPSLDAEGQCSARPARIGSSPSSPSSRSSCPPCSARARCRSTSCWSSRRSSRSASRCSWDTPGRSRSARRPSTPRAPTPPRCCRYTVFRPGSACWSRRSWRPFLR